MDRLYHFIGKHLPEICALIASAVMLAVGSYLAWNYNPAWLNRAGTLIIIIGVLLAASRFHDWVQQKMAGFIEANYETISQDALAALEKRANEPLSEEKRASFRSTVKERILNDLGSLFEPDKRRLKLWEIYLVVCGTFLNGFGDYIISLLKGNGT